MAGGRSPAAEARCVRPRRNKDRRASITSYRIRRSLRAAASLVAALALTGVVLLVRHALTSTDRVLALLFAVVLAVAGFWFGLLAWTGRGSASVEEYGLDDPAEVERYRVEAAARNGLQP